MGKGFNLPLKKRFVIPSQVNTAKVRLRLALHGPRSFLRYHIVAIPNKARRDALPLEKLGEWDPEARDRALPGVEEYAGRTATRYEKRIEWNEGRIMWWLMEGGAEPTTRVVWLLEKAGLLRQGEHPWHNNNPRPFPVNVPFTGHWPEEDPKVPIRLPGTRVKGTSYLLSIEGRRIQAEYQRQQEERERVGYKKEMYGGVGPGGGARILGPKWVNVPGKGATAKSWKEGETEKERDDREFQEEEDREWEEAPEEKL